MLIAHRVREDQVVGPESGFYGLLILAGRIYDFPEQMDQFGFESLEFFGACAWVENTFLSY